MTIKYDTESDTLTVLLGPERFGAYDLKAGDFTVVLGHADNLMRVSIANASHFVARALAAGVEVEGAPDVEPPQAGLVWHDADSSMISASAYDDAEGILEIAFHRTGV
jgi:hypothetical protein